MNLDTRKRDALKNSPLAQEMTDDEINLLSDLIEILEFSDGETLLEEGAASNHLYVVVSGIVAVTKYDSKKATETVLHQLGPGDLVGELSFMDDTPRYAALKAQGPVCVFRLSRNTFELLVPTHPWVVYKTMRAIMRTVHALQRRMSMQMIELTNYIWKQGGRY
jgi:CRP-like cAMP-binding protein